ncbi:MAG: class I SAM-dependent methyltransferase [Gemmatimonadaceae bacterium]
MQTMALPPAAAAFDAIADAFDERFGGWASVNAQRRAVRAELVAAFAPGARVLELGGGTGEDAAWLAREGRIVQFTDPSPAMVRVAGEKLRALGMPEPVVADAADLGSLTGAFDGAFSNFAAMNCVADLPAVARGLSRLIRPGGSALLVLFGTACPAEWLTQVARGRARQAFRRATRGDVRARLGGREFTVRYHRRADLERAFAPSFELAEQRGIGVFVPPSDAEPWISAHSTLLAALEGMDRLTSRLLAPLGDHVLYRFVRRA